MKTFEETIGDDFERPDIDDLTILQATEVLAEYCLTGQDETTTCIANKMITDGLYVAVGMTRDESSDDRNERWVHRLRLSTFSDPFRAYSGLDVWLPYGAAACRELPEVGEVAPADKKSERAGVFVSYAEGKEFWNPKELSPRLPVRPYDYWRDRVKIPFDVTRDTVGQVDQRLLADTRMYNRPGIGFTLKEAIALVDQGHYGLVTLEPENGIDLRTKRRKISEIITGILFV